MLRLPNAAPKHSGTGHASHPALQKLEPIELEMLYGLSTGRKSVEVGLDHAFDDFDIVSAGHGGQALPYESFGDQGFEISQGCRLGHVSVWKDSFASTDIAAPAAKANQLN